MSFASSFGLVSYNDTWTDVFSLVCFDWHLILHLGLNQSTIVILVLKHFRIFPAFEQWFEQTY